MPSPATRHATPKPLAIDMLGAASRWIDVVMVIAAAPFVLLTGAPLVGYLAGAAAWTVARVLGHLIERRAEAATDLRTRAGLTLLSSFGRAWTVGLAILVVGLTVSREDGLAAAIVTVAAFTIYLVCSLVLRPLERKTPAA